MSLREKTSRSQSKKTTPLDYDVIIIGAGAAGLFCAIQAAQRGRRVLVLDKAKKAGKKILISGGGRCNFTNLYTDPSAYRSQNPHFCKSALKRYTPWDFIAFLEDNQLTWHEKTLGQLFCDQKSKAVVEMLLSHCHQQQVTIQLNTVVQEIQHTQDQHRFLLKTQISPQQTNTQIQTFQAQSLVIASGGPSIPRMGATDFALQIAKQFGLRNIPFRPALVPFTFSGRSLKTLCQALSGVSLPVEVCCKGQCFRESMLFTHRGLSGPAILQISSYWQKGDTIHINLLAEADSEWLWQAQKESPNSLLSTLLTHTFPKRFAQYCYQHILGFAENEQIKLKQLNEAQCRRIIQPLSDWSLKPAGTEGMRTAEVSLGGVSTDELSSKTFESRKVKGLYFIGEAIDVTGHLGGYNFQWAWSSAWCAGQYVSTTPELKTQGLES